MSLSVRDFQNSTVALRSVENIRTAAVVNIGGVGDGVKSHYAAIFDRYANVQNNLLKQLNAVFGSNIPLDSNRHVVFTDFIKDVCTDSDRANEAYKFYGRQIIEQINQLGDYILKARDFLRQTGDADIEKWVIDQLNILDIFSNEIEKAFGFRYVYDFNEDAWKSVEDDYTAQTHTQVQKQTTYEKLRAVQVDAYEKEGVFTKKVIEVFNELNLLDRLKYIKLYYDINDGKTDALFPNDKISGTPIVKEAYALMKDAPYNFIGNIEGRQIPFGDADVVVADGFTGNLILKTYEGVAKVLMNGIKEAFYKRFLLFYDNLPNYYQSLYF